MKERLPSVTYKKMLRTVRDGEPLRHRRGQRRRPRHEGVGHRAGRHPLHALVPAPRRALPAEKHESFLIPDATGDGGAITGFSGKDARSRASPTRRASPPAGCAATFEARGYAAWDRSQPRPSHAGGRVGGDPLHPHGLHAAYTRRVALRRRRPPLLRSLTRGGGGGARRCAAPLRLLGRDRASARSVGAEQEYFLIKERGPERPAPGRLVLTGRTPLRRPTPPRARSWRSTTSARSAPR